MEPPAKTPIDLFFLAKVHGFDSLNVEFKVIAPDDESPGIARVLWRATRKGVGYGEAVEVDLLTTEVEHAYEVLMDGARQYILKVVG